MEDEDTLEKLIKDYETQLSQMNSVLEITEDSTRSEIVALCDDLKQLIELTKDSLLSKKKARLLKEIESLEQSQIALPTEGSTSTTSPKAEPASSSADYKYDHQDLENLLLSLEGSKCQAPYGHSWGQMAYHNALVLSVEASEELSSMDDIQVRVVFCYPTINKMKPCPFYMEGKCRFSDSECRFSHGHVVSFQTLRPFSDPDYSLLQRDVTCLAKYTDGLWYPAIVESVDDDNHTVTVKYKEDGTIATVELADVLPDDAHDSLSDSSDDDYDDDVDEEAEEREDFKPNVIWVSTAPTSAPLGDWEKYTKGIGSKLMMKMGYVLGNGLGKNGEGRTEPVEAVVLPPGKSLDVVMQLKEEAGSRDLIKAEKKLKRKLRKKEKSAAAGYHHKPKSSVFDFINKKLGDDVNKETKDKEKCKPLSATQQMLKSTSTKNLNAKSFQVAEDIRRSQLELERLQTALTRNESKDRIVSSQLREKISKHQNSIYELQTLEKAIHSEQHLRKCEKKLTIF